jgi:uracil-DNA glycosylase
MLQEGHMARLTAYVARLRRMGLGQVPNFDPLDGGDEARILFLFQKPGRMTSDGSGKKAGSGFISRNNDDAAAEATFKLMNEAGLPRKETVSWNIIPWWNGTHEPTEQELDEASEQLQALLDLLPRLKAVVMVGKKAQTARRQLERHDRELKLIESWMPVPLVKNRWPEKWQEILLKWRLAAHVLS